jgi:hypothetical protein
MSNNVSAPSDDPSRSWDECESRSSWPTRASSKSTGGARERGHDCRCTPGLAGIIARRGTGFHHRDPGDTFPVDATTEEASADDYDALVLPGGVVNADAIRLDHHAVRFVRQCFEANKP